MTAHGLGAFVGWAAFAVMGFSYWVLAEVGYPIGAPARRIGMVAWWTMVLGVAGVVVTTLLFSFGGSWVFLYPLPFESAGQWGDHVTAFFSLLGAARRRLDHRLVRLDHRDRHRPGPRLRQERAATASAPRWASASCGRASSSARARCPTRSSRSR